MIGRRELILVLYVLYEGGFNSLCAPLVIIGECWRSIGSATLSGYYAVRGSVELKRRCVGIYLTSYTVCLPTTLIFLHSSWQKIFSTYQIGAAAYINIPYYIVIAFI